uniref:Uncharacterized protein n=1 Tax=Ciona intestinalis TaxID=7719 RepID=F6WVY5_CIOIN
FAKFSQSIPEKNGCSIRRSYPPHEALPSLSIGLSWSSEEIKFFASRSKFSGNSYLQFTICWKIKYSFGALKGNSPVNIWYTMHPSAHKSELLQAFLSLSNSGDT